MRDELETVRVDPGEGEDEVGAQRRVHVFREEPDRVLAVASPARRVAYCPVPVVVTSRPGGRGCTCTQ